MVNYSKLGLDVEKVLGEHYGGDRNYYSVLLKDGRLCGVEDCNGFRIQYFNSLEQAIYHFNMRMTWCYNYYKGRLNGDTTNT